MRLIKSTAPATGNAFLRKAASGSVDVERLGTGRLAAGVERDLLDAGLGLAQQLLAAALQAFAALIDRNRLLKRNFAFLETLHDGFKLLDSAFEGQTLDVVVVAFSHACFRLSAIRGQYCSVADLKFLQQSRQIRIGTSNRKATLESYSC